MLCSPCTDLSLQPLQYALASVENQQQKKMMGECAAKSYEERLEEVNLYSLEKTLGDTFAIYKYLQGNNINERSPCSQGW